MNINTKDQNRKFNHNNKKVSQRFNRTLIGSQKSKTKILIKACKDGDLEIVKYLIQHAVNVNVQDKKYYGWINLQPWVNKSHL